MRALFAAYAVLLLVLGYWVITSFRSGVGPVARPSSSGRESSQTRLVHPESESRSTDAGLFGQVAQSPERGESQQLHGVEPGSPQDAGQSLALASILADYEWGTDGEAIAWLTIDGWNDPGFLELTEDEAHELLALDDNAGYHGPGTLVALMGPMPTKEDCERAAANQRVQAALREAIGWEAMVVELGQIPANRRVRGKLEASVRAKDDAELALMTELDKATGQEWTLWWRLFRRWSE